MADLQPIYYRFLRRLDILETVFVNWTKAKPSNLRDEDLMFLEGMVSSLWQHWSLFCRRVIFSYALGCTTRTGNEIPSSVTPRTWERVSYIAWRANSGGSIQPMILNTILRKEPTWGDVEKMQTIVRILIPSNAGHLVSCFGSVFHGPKHLQIVRNAASHRNFQTFNDVKKLRNYYNSKPMRHPAEVVIWTEPISNGFVFMDWAEEIRILSDMITR